MWRSSETKTNGAAGAPTLSGSALDPRSIENSFEVPVVDDTIHLNWILAGVEGGAQCAAVLLDEFESFAPIFGASSARHYRLTGNIDATRQLASFRAAALRLARAQLDDRRFFGCMQQLIDYLRSDLGHRPVECVRILFLNRRNYLLRDELMWTGTIDECAFHVRQVIARALDIGAASLILVHNHPCGDPKASRDDIDLTRAISYAGKWLGIAVLDHIIISRSSHSSMREAGLI